MNAAITERGGEQRRGWAIRIGNRARLISVERLLAIVLMALGAGCGLATYFAFFNIWSSQIEGERVISRLLYADIAIALALGAIVGHRLVVLWRNRRRGLAGARLHARLVMLFALIAVVPTVIIAVFSTAFLSRGLDTWFSERIQDAIESSGNIVQSYLAEQRSRITNDASEIVQALWNSGVLASDNPRAMSAFLDREVTLRDLTEAVIITRDRNIVARAGNSGLMELGLELPESAFDRADAGEVVNTSNAIRDRIRAVASVRSGSRYYLYIGRVFDERIRSAALQNQSAFVLYKQLANARSKLQITVGLTFAVLAILVLMAAVWVAILYASQLVKPVSRLAAAAEQIGGGDLSARVKIGLAEDELSALSRTFNVMAIQLQSQQHALIAANRQMDDRRRFTELVLSGVSAGVIGLADDGTIDLPNRSASELLGVNLLGLIGQPLASVSPDMAEIVERARARNSGTADGQIMHTSGTISRTLHVRVVSEVGDEGHTKLVVTFDDVSELLSAQRKAAWADIARRIAHEIKNPLTPIQLSAERLKRKYLRQITEDPDTFTACTETIVRQVGDIGRMVDEFSAFARMPAPSLRPEEACELTKQAAFLQQSAHPAIAYQVDLPPGPVELVCDASQFNRAITNLMKNAAESVEERIEEQRGRGEPAAPGEIRLWMRRSDDRLVIGIDDNGRGLPEHNRDRLTEPYVTTRSKGTGLGLAIVKKIMEDHGGTLTLADRDGGGASVLMTFPLDAAMMNVADSAQTPPIGTQAAVGSA
ncbi:MAG TPA: PAS domain-containing sensor histidine kinase [Dongiaceae bacterium]|nr:PAS domain-containing sensor histidine kinase [Dongiaceae bacterium]